MSAVKVELWSTPDCPNVEAVRNSLDRALAELRLDLGVAELVGDYPSPSVIVDGIDVVTGAAPTTTIGSCRLDLPTYDQLLKALVGHSGSGGDAASASSPASGSVGVRRLDQADDEAD